MWPRRWSVGVSIACLAACSAEERQTTRDTSSATQRTPAASSTSYHLIGTEPFWSIDVTSGGLRYTTPEDTNGIRFPPVAAEQSGDTLHWSGRTERATIEARIWPAQCSDGMSDRVWPYDAIVTIEAKTLRGCAEPRG